MPRGQVRGRPADRGRERLSRCPGVAPGQDLAQEGERHLRGEVGLARDGRLLARVGEQVHGRLAGERARGRVRDPDRHAAAPPDGLEEPQDFGAAAGLRSDHEERARAQEAPAGSAGAPRTRRSPARGRPRRAGRGGEQGRGGTSPMPVSTTRARLPSRSREAISASRCRDLEPPVCLLERPWLVEDVPPVGSFDDVHGHACSLPRGTKSVVLFCHDSARLVVGGVTTSGDHTL